VLQGLLLEQQLQALRGQVQGLLVQQQARAQVQELVLLFYHKLPRQQQR
jgi:hypothetical protein